MSAYMVVEIIHNSLFIIIIIIKISKLRVYRHVMVTRRMVMRIFGTGVINRSDRAVLIFQQTLNFYLAFRYK